MSVRITWAPSSHPDIASYSVEVASDVAGPYAFLVSIPHNLVGANYDADAGVFFYTHGGGTLDNWYRLISVDSGNNQSVPSAPIEPVSSTPTVLNNVKVDHNYGSPANLRYQASNGTPVEGALIRVYTKAAYDQGETDQPLAITMTNAQGNWVNPVYLTGGVTYTLVFAKEGLYGPDAREVIV